MAEGVQCWAARADVVWNGASTWSAARGAVTVMVALCVAWPVSASASVPPNFDDQLVANLLSPTALAFTPDGRMLITHKDGILRIRKNGTMLSTPALDLTATTCGDNERGMLGVAVDNAFATNHFIYLFYTFKKFGGCEFDTAERAGQPRVAVRARETTTWSNPQARRC